MRVFIAKADTANDLDRGYSVYGLWTSDNHYHSCQLSDVAKNLNMNRQTLKRRAEKAGCLMKFGHAWGIVSKDKQRLTEFAEPFLMAAEMVGKEE